MLGRSPQQKTAQSKKNTLLVAKKLASKLECSFVAGEAFQLLSDALRKRGLNNDPGDHSPQLTLRLLASDRLNMREAKIVKEDIRRILRLDANAPFEILEVLNIWHSTTFASNEHYLHCIGSSSTADPLVLSMIAEECYSRSTGTLSVALSVNTDETFMLCTYTAHGSQ